MRKASVLILVGLFLTATAPAFARHHHGGDWRNQDWGCNSYYGTANYNNYNNVGYYPRQGFLNYLVNGNPPGFSYFRQNGYYRPSWGQRHQDNGWHRGWYGHGHGHHRHWDD